MAWYEIIVGLFIAAGAVILAISMISALRILPMVKDRHLAGYWRLLYYLMAVFLAGYLAAIVLLLVDRQEIILVLTGAVFLGGAGFILLAVRLGYLTISDLNHLAATLDQQVQSRTGELQLTNQQLLQEVKSHRQARKDLEQAKARYHSLFEDSRDAVYISTCEGKFIDINASCVGLFGYSRDEIMALNIRDLYADPDDRGRFKELIAGQGFVKDYEVTLRRKDGKEITCLLTSTLRLDKDGNKLGYQGIIHDITDRKRMEGQLYERRRALHLIISSMPNVLLVVGDDDRLSAFFLPPHFPPVINTKELTSEQMLAQVLPGEMIGETLYGLEKVRRLGKQITIEQSVVLDGGKEASFFKIKIVPVTDSGDILVVIDDITDLKRAEETIRSYADELELRNQDLDTFSHMVAHDLKSPLSGIRGYADILLMYHKDDLIPEVFEFLTEIEKITDIMQEMIDSLLMLARLRDADQVNDVVQMKPVVEAVMIRLQSMIKERGVRIEIQPNLPDGVGHAPWLEEVFANLVSNAIKYIGRENPDPQITIRGHQLDGKARYEVEDNGVGIQPEDQKKLFEMFSRFHHNEASGSGLGLSIVSRIVSKLGGEVGVESIPGKGSTFWFTLPVL